MSIAPPSFATDIRAQLPRAHNEERVQRSTAGVSLISVHYDAVERPHKYDGMARLRGEANYHISKDWNPPNGVYGFGLMYHIRIEDEDDTDGKAEVYFCNDLEDLLWNVTNANRIAVAVCCSCGDNQDLTPEMYRVLQQVIEWFLSVLPGTSRTRTFGHGELTQYGNSTHCPGPELPWVQNYRKGATQPPMPNTQFFPETGHSVGNAFLDYFNAHGGVAVFGFPITEEVAGKVGNWQGTIQYFQRARFEWHTESGAGNVQLGLLGAEALEHGYTTLDVVH